MTSSEERTRIAAELRAYAPESWRSDRYVPELRRRGTCTVESSHSAWGEDDPWYEFELSCGDRFPWWDSTPPDFCPYCGCEVITDAD